MIVFSGRIRAEIIQRHHIGVVMKKSLVSVLLIATSFTALAHSDNADFYAADTNPETEICLAAATAGFNAAKLKAKEFGPKYTYNLQETQCNGVNIKSFAKNVSAKTKQSLPAVYANDDSYESALCASAANNGLSQLNKHARYSLNNVKCNGKSLREFAKENG